MYATNSFRVIADVLEKKTGLTYQTLVSEYIGKPASAPGTTATTSEIAAGAYVQSTIEDMAKIALHFVNGRYVSDTTINQMLTDYTNGYGLGFFVSTDAGDKIGFHSGSNGTPKAYLFVNPTKNVGVGLFCTASGGFGSSSYLRDLAQPVAQLIAAGNPCQIPSECASSNSLTLIPATIQFMGIKLGTLSAVQPLQIWIDVLLKIFTL